LGLQFPFYLFIYKIMIIHFRIFLTYHIIFI